MTGAFLTALMQRAIDEARLTDKGFWVIPARDSRAMKISDGTINALKKRGLCGSHPPVLTPAGIAARSLPDGLWERDGKILFECCVCGNATELLVDVAEFDPEVRYCGGSPRCCP